MSIYLFQKGLLEDRKRMRYIKKKTEISFIDDRIKIHLTLKIVSYNCHPREKRKCKLLTGNLNL